MEQRHYQSLEASEAVSDASEDLEPRVLERHAPGSQQATKITHIPSDLKSLIEERLKAFPSYEYDHDDGDSGDNYGNTGDAPIYLGPRQLPCHTIYIGQWLNKQRHGKGQ